MLAQVDSLLRQLHYLPGTATGQTSERDIQLVRQFFSGAPATQSSAFGSARLLSPTQVHLTNQGTVNPLVEKSWTDPSLRTGFRPLESIPSRGGADWTMEFNKLVPAPQYNQNPIQQNCM